MSYTDQFKNLPPRIRDLIRRDMAASPIDADSTTPFSFSMSPDAEIPVAMQGAVFKEDAPKYTGAVGPLSLTDVQDLVVSPPGPEPAQQKAPEAGALTRAAPPREPPDYQALLAQFVPEGASGNKYLAMAAALAKPRETDSFGEKLGNISEALLLQKQNQETLRARYLPLILQQVAQQQAREEQATYRLEAQQLARQAQLQAAAQAHQNRVDLATQAQQSANERADADRVSREQIAAGRVAEAKQRSTLANKPPQGYVWGPASDDGQPTMVAVKGGPADAKIAGALNADTQSLVGATSSFDRLASAANQVLQHPGLPGITGMRGIIPNIPGSQAADAQALLGTLKSQVGFGVLQDMRNQSKTGGALGAVSEKELAMLQSNLAALDKAQSLEQFQQGLKHIVDYAEKAKDRMREAYNLKHSDKSGAPVQPLAQPAGADPLGIFTRK